MHSERDSNAANDWDLILIPSSRNLSDCESGNERGLFPFSPWNQRSENFVSSRCHNQFESKSGNGQSQDQLAVHNQTAVKGEFENFSIGVSEAPKISGDQPDPTKNAYFNDKKEQEVIFKITKHDRKLMKEKAVPKNRKIISKCPHTSMKYYAKGMCK